MILHFRAATLADADSVADVYLCSRKELVACARWSIPTRKFASGSAGI